jgi:hypothetical protein
MDTSNDCMNRPISLIASRICFVFGALKSALVCEIQNKRDARIGLALA